MTKPRARFSLLFPLLLLSASAHAAGDVQQITAFGANPSGIGMFLYTPSNVSARPAVVVNVHACHGKGTDVCGPSGAFAQQADQYGFLVICPSAVSSDGCWDVHSASVLAHDGGGDATGIVSMVKWVVQNKNGDPERVFVAGHSSGGMMTNVMLGSYPDVFHAGAAYAGVPFACYAQGTVDNLGWNSDCAQGKVTMTGKAWGDLVRGAFSTFSGTRPRIQIWHGTKDEVVYFQNFKEEIKQWTNVLGVSETPTTTETDALQATWIRTRYTDSAGAVAVEAIEETGQPHNLVVDAKEAIHFFGLDGPAPVSDAGVKDAAVDGRMGTGGAGGNGAGGNGAGGSGGQDASGTGGPGGAGGVSSAVGGSAAGGGGRPGAGGQAGGAAGAGGQTAPVGSGGRATDAAIDSAGSSGGASGGSMANGGGPGSGGRSGLGGSGTGGAGGAGGAGAGGAGAGAQGGSSAPGSSSSRSSGCAIAGRRSGHAMLWPWLGLALLWFRRRHAGGR
jgi:poly(hydroxyalkanoate) depolymerase family esterase